MKIGILTFHRAHNYGAVLQAYALREYLKMFCSEVEIVDYVPFYFRVYNKIPTIKDCVSLSIPKLFKNIAFFPLVRRRYRAFSIFINKQLSPSKRQYLQNDIISDYDVLVYGSDQIWNGIHTNGPDNIFWGYMTNQKVRKIAYAASSADSFFVKERMQYVKNALLNFDRVSVREQNIAEILKRYTTKNIALVVDPVLLLTKEEWESKLNLQRRKSDYVLVYQVRENPLSLMIAKEYARKKNLKVVILTKMIYQRVDRRLNQTASPIEFVNLIKNAALVVTTSFHGTVFSIIFRKNFYTINISPEINSRSISILNSIGLSDRLVSIKPQDYCDVDYNDISISRLKELINESKEYIAQAVFGK